MAKFQLVLAYLDDKQVCACVHGMHVHGRVHTTCCMHTCMVCILSCALHVHPRLDDAQDALPAAWGHAGKASALLAPCALGVVAGVLPVCYAMILSRSRAERRDAMAGDLALKRYKRQERKELTGPRPVLRGDPPNPAMLNPVIEGGRYALNYHAGVGAGGGTTSAGSAKIDSV